MGKLGEKRKRWVMDENQSSVKRIGTDRQFEKVFVEPPDAIYRLVEEVNAETVSGKVFEFIG